jgi:transposase InsO family protein
MQIKSLRIKSYRSWKINDTILSEIARERLRKIQIYDQLRTEGCSEKTALNAVQIARSTLFRWKNKLDKEGLKGLEPGNTVPKNTRTSTWSRELEFQVCALRKANPCYGKYKIKTLLKREQGLEVKVSMVGRILSKLIKVGRVKAVPALLGRRYPKKKRIFNKHAKRWKYGMKAKNPGELIQIDHMSVQYPGSSIKHFKAVCPISRFMVAHVFRSATSKHAAEFLEQIIAEMPFKIHSIQVDGGSEFMKYFEEACLEKGIELFVLPPKKPEWNGNVERCNGTTRDEFYSFYEGTYDPPVVNIHLKRYQDRFNTYRPHQALQYLTPMEYYQLNYQNRAA